MVAAAVYAGCLQALDTATGALSLNPVRDEPPDIPSV